MKKENNLIMFFKVIGYLSFGLSIPVLNEQVVLAFGSKGLAIERLVELIATMALCIAYKQTRIREFIKRTLLIVFMISILITITAVIVMFIKGFDPMMFLVCHVVSYCILTTYVLRAIVGLRAWFFSDPDKREDYDNTNKLWTAIGGLAGFGISSFLVIPVYVALILYVISLFDIFGWVLVFLKHRKEYLRNKA